ncbi:MAG: hypothetical protein EXR91_08180 [Gemmatimonadetes bacterium]|nr:hypothetical protein [Gemmatimonadota bacterium]
MITSIPAAATLATVPPSGEFTTPASVQLERKHSYTVTARRQGYRDATGQITRKLRTGPVILDILFTGLLGVVVDAATGGWYDLQPENVILSLEQVDASLDGPDVISVTVAFDQRSAGVATVRSSTPVQIEVVKN